MPFERQRPERAIDGGDVAFDGVVHHWQMHQQVEPAGDFLVYACGGEREKHCQRRIVRRVNPYDPSPYIGSILVAELARENTVFR